MRSVNKLVEMRQEAGVTSTVDMSQAAAVDLVKRVQDVLRHQHGIYISDEELTLNASDDITTLL